METKFKGPWEQYEERISAGLDYRLTFQSVRDSTGTNIARLHNRETARLIAAAPELYAALEESLMIYEEPMDFDIQAYYDKVKVLLAQARGEE